MLSRTRIVALVACVAFAGLSSSAVAGDIDFDKIDNKMQGLGGKVLTLKNVASQVKSLNPEIGGPMLDRAKDLQVYLNTVYQNVNVLKNNPNNEQSLEWAIQYSHEAKEAAEDIERLMHRFRRWADREDQDNYEQAARVYARLADDVEDRMRSVKNELD